MVESPALRYHGAKFRLAPWIMQFFPAHQTYVEPFGGAAGVLLQKPRSYAEIYNDLDGAIVNFFRVLRNPETRARLIEQIRLTPYARAEFEQAWEDAADDVERARRVAIRAQMGFGSAGATKGVTGFRIDTKRAYGKGLSGLDGAAQAGMVRAEVQRLGRIGEALLVARHAPQSVPCSCRKACCSGYRPNKEWTDAVAIISDHVRATALAGCTTNALLRRAYVVRCFTPKAQRVALEAIADAAEIDRHTVSAHAAKVAAMLGGQKARAGHQAVPGLEEAALQAITDQLREIGMVGDTA